MAMHLADGQSREHHDNYIIAGDSLRALMRRKDVKTIRIDNEELLDRVERLVIEQDEDGSVDVSLVRDPVDDSAGN